MRNFILKHALKNALNFNGSVNPHVVLGLVLREKAELKQDVSKVIQEINQIVQEVEKLSLKEIKQKLGQLAPELLQEKEEEKEEKIEGPLKPLPNAQKGKVITRIAPSPSGPLHIGHAYGASLNYEYARMYKGKFILRIEDTNPENIYPQAYNLIKEDVQWLAENKVSRVVIQSSRLGIYYDYAEKLVGLGKAYVCLCDVDKWREMKNKGKACRCRELDKKEQHLRYAKMFNQYAEGEAVLRLKTEINHKNPAMRDFAIMRINEHIHPKTGKENKVWPLMVFSVAIDDHELGVTHVLNGKDHADNSKKEAIIMKDLDWTPPEYKHWGRINFTGLKLSTSKTRIAIEQGEYDGWDDIRLPTLPALRRRGYQPEAFRRYALEIGLSLNDKTVPIEEFWKNVNAFNKEIVEKKANRYFFVDEPVKVMIEGLKKREVQIDFHPDFPKRGKRKLIVNKEVYLSKKDKQQLKKGMMHRLMDCCNFEVKGNKIVFVSEKYEDYKNAKNKGQIIHWLPADNTLKAELLMEDNKITSGLGEEAMKLLLPGEIVQLERRYFARVDQKSKNKISLWYLHK